MKKLALCSFAVIAFASTQAAAETYNLACGWQSQVIKAEKDKDPIVTHKNFVNFTLNFTDDALAAGKLEEIIYQNELPFETSLFALHVTKKQKDPEIASTSLVVLNIDVMIAAPGAEGAVFSYQSWPFIMEQVKNVAIDPLYVDARQQVIQGETIFDKAIVAYCMPAPKA